MKKLLIILLAAISSSLSAQEKSEHISKIVLNKKEKKIFNAGRDSSIVLHIDTLIMKDKSSLQFYGKKEVKLIIDYAEIGDKVFINGLGRQNNASNFDIDININKLGSLYLIAKGEDAINGTKTNPNGDGGIVNFNYLSTGIAPQTTDKKAKNYLFIDTQPGGLRVNPTSDLRQIYSMVQSAPTGLRGVPQGQIYSGSPGKEGKSTINQK